MMPKIFVFGESMNAVDQAITVSAKTTYGGAAGAMLFGLTANEVAAVGSLFIAFLGLLANIYFMKKRHDLLVEQYINNPSKTTKEQLSDKP